MSAVGLLVFHRCFVFPPEQRVAALCSTHTAYVPRPNLHESAMHRIMLSIAVLALSMSCMLGAVVYATIDRNEEAAARPAQTHPVPVKVVRPQLWAAAEISVVRWK